MKARRRIQTNKKKKEPGGLSNATRQFNGPTKEHFKRANQRGQGENQTYMLPDVKPLSKRKKAMNPSSN